MKIYLTIKHTFKDFFVNILMRIYRNKNSTYFINTMKNCKQIIFGAENECLSECTADDLVCNIRSGEDDFFTTFICIIEMYRITISLNAHQRIF